MCTFKGLVAIYDWYSTFAAAAGVSAVDNRAAAAGLPPVDGISMWDYIRGVQTESPRKLLVLGTTHSAAQRSNHRPRNRDTVDPIDGGNGAGSDGTTSGVQGVTGVNGIIVSDEEGLWKLLLGNITQNGWQGTYE